MRQCSFALLSLTYLLTAPAYAMFCPGTFSEIEYGDSIDTVKQQCGTPTSEKDSESEAFVPQEWNYYVQISSQLGFQAIPGGQATLKTSIAFDKGLVTNMSVNGIGISTTAICNGNNVNIGDTQESVKKACGTPAYINKGNIDTPPKTKVAELTYSTGGGAPVTLVFEDGVFKSKK